MKDNTMKKMGVALIVSSLILTGCITGGGRTLSKGFGGGALIDREKLPDGTTHESYSVTGGATVEIDPETGKVVITGGRDALEDLRELLAPRCFECHSFIIEEKGA